MTNQRVVVYPGDRGATIAPLPIMVVAFTFHNMIPSLMSYLGSRKLMLKVGRCRLHSNDPWFERHWCQIVKGPKTKGV